MTQSHAQILNTAPAQIGRSGPQEGQFLGRTERLAVYECPERDSGSAVCMAKELTCSAWHKSCYIIHYRYNQPETGARQ